MTPKWVRTIELRNCTACPRPAVWRSTVLTDAPPEYLCDPCYAALYPEYRNEEDR